MKIYSKSLEKHQIGGVKPGDISIIRTGIFLFLTHYMCGGIDNDRLLCAMYLYHKTCKIIVDEVYECYV